MMNNFLQQNLQLPQEAPQPFAMEQMRRDLDGYRINSPQADLPAWMQEYNAGEHDRMEAAFKSPAPGLEKPFLAQAAPDLSRAELLNQFNAANTDPVHQFQGSLGMNGYQRPMGMGYGMGMGMMGTPQFRSAMQSPLAEQMPKGKGKERMVELDDKDWEQQFAQMDTQGEDIDAEARQAMEEELNQMDRSVNQSETNEFGDLESIWRGIQAETADRANRTLNGEENQYGMHMENDFPQTNFETWDGFDSHFHEEPEIGNYLFEQENPFAATKDPFEEGNKIMREGGNLSLAALAFEAAVQKDSKHVQAWVQLGSAQAQNEKELPAIRALEQAIKLDPTNLAALMGLAISYTNEGYDSTAFRTLERWLATKYPEIVSPDDLTPDNEYGFTDRFVLHEKVTDLFIRAANLSPDGAHMDPDVQVGLGVLFYGKEEYVKAVDCFQAALDSTAEGVMNEPQQRHLLWNRLGATLANSGRSEDAIGAYEEALTLNPNFVRARYNLGVSCINIGVYEQAVQHLLGALAMHNVVEREGVERVREVMGEDISGDSKGGLNPDEVERMVGMNQSTNLIETLRRVFGTMGRRDLADRVERGMDVEAFRGEFDF